MRFTRVCHHSHFPGAVALIHDSDRYAFVRHFATQPSVLDPGILGDRFASLWPLHGRALVGQMSIVLGAIPLFLGWFQ